MNLGDARHRFYGLQIHVNEFRISKIKSIFKAIPCASRFLISDLVLKNLNSVGENMSVVSTDGSLYIRESNDSICDTLHHKIGKTKRL